MDYRCPHCQTSLRYRRVRPPRQANAIAAGDATLCCPQCGGGLLLNHSHQEAALLAKLNELTFSIIGLFAMICAAALHTRIHPLITFLVVIALFLAALAWQLNQLYTVTLKHWPRHIKASLRYIEQYQPPG